MLRELLELEEQSLLCNHKYDHNPNLVWFNKATEGEEGESISKLRELLEQEEQSLLFIHG